MRLDINNGEEGSAIRRPVFYDLFFPKAREPPLMVGGFKAPHERVEFGTYLHKFDVIVYSPYNCQNIRHNSGVYFNYCAETAI